MLAFVYGRVAERSQLSAAEYLAWEREQSTRHEFFRGDVFAMAGGSPRHNALCLRIGGALHAALQGRGCIEFSSDQVALANGAELDVDRIFAGVFDLPDD